MYKKLLIKDKPVIDIYSGVSGTVAIQQLNPNYIPVIIANHFLITYHYDLDSPGFNWNYYNNIGSHYIDIRAIIKSKKKIISEILKLINDNYYVQIVLDHYYISESGKYHEDHFLHDKSLIYGYDDEKEIFYISDNFRNGKICTLEVSYNEVVNARKYNKNYAAQKVRFDLTIDYDLSIDYICRLLKSYIMEENHLHDKNTYQEEILYGAALYNVLEDLIDNVMIDVIDLRTFYIFENHFKICKMLCEFIRDKYLDIINTTASLEEKFGDLYNRSMILRNLYLKLVNTKSIELAKSMHIYVNEMKKAEIGVLNDMLNILTK